MPKPLRKVAEVVNGLRSPSLREFNRAMERAGKASFSEWENEVYTYL